MIGVLAFKISLSNKTPWIIICLFYHGRAETIEILLAISGNLSDFWSEIDDKI
ncbi:MAG: hypothetical protein F6K23_23290 [Okeania sp. SIO2C9]|uniref:hypothetical protein n=1 Tax=Okeania sp. SIO2C9 TaxID=2607791 RepID=UPI0013C00952|nr:hypothetical protein [Okeania sp. SIO2C9]NEQ75711.1 hypothetical protein [Okeania sp. SIO2C9]